MITEATVIASKLLKCAKHDKRKIVWEINQVDKQRNIIRKYDYSLATGSIGIIYFLIELYTIKKNKNHFIAIEKSIIGLDYILKVEPSKNYGLYSGKSGLIYLFIKLYYITNDEKYLDRSFAIACSTEEFIRSTQTNNSLFEGRAGLLMMLTELYKIKPKELLEEFISLTLHKILWDANYTPEGIYWYSHQTQTGIVSSFGYGTAGIAFALNRFQEEIKMKGLDSIILYAIKNYYYAWNSQVKNWPDHNYKVETPKQDSNLIKIIKNDRKSKLLLKGKVSDDFIDGKLGIMFALYNFQKSHKNKKEFSGLINKVGQSAFNFNGNLPLNYCVLQTLYKTIVTPYTLQYSSSMFNQIKLKYLKDKIKPTNLNLTSGMAGLGYYFLLAHEPVAYPYFTFRFYESTNKTLHKNFSFNKLKLIPLLKYFPRTYTLLVASQKKGQLTKESAKLINNPVFFPKIIEGLLVNQLGQSSVINDCYKLEITKYKMICRPPIAAYYFGKRYIDFIENRKLQKLSDDSLINLTYVLSPHIKIVRTKYDVSENNVTIGKNINKSKSEAFTLLISYDGKELIREQKLVELEEILIYFKKPIKGVTILKQIELQLGVERNNLQIKSKMIDLILTFVQNGVLTKCT